MNIQEIVQCRGEYIDSSASHRSTLGWLGFAVTGDSPRCTAVSAAAYLTAWGHQDPGGDAARIQRRVFGTGSHHLGPHEEHGQGGHPSTD
jgi:hypothetical protein